MTASKLTFAEVIAAFEAAYARLREAVGENAPSSYTWFAPTLAELSEAVGEEIDAAAVAGAVAYAYECNGNTVEAITPDMTAEAVEELFWGMFGCE